MAASVDSAVSVVTSPTLEVEACDSRAHDLQPHQVCKGSGVISALRPHELVAATIRHPPITNSSTVERTRVPSAKTDIVAKSRSAHAPLSLATRAPL